MKKILDLINSYGFFVIKIFLYEFFFILLGYKGNNFVIRNNKFSTDTIPSPYFFLHEIYTVIKKKNVRSLIDLGCGNGRVINFFNRKLKINYTGVELFTDSFFSCQKMFKKYKKVKIINQNFFDIKIRNLKYDCYFINDPTKNLRDHNLLIKNLFLAQRYSKKPFYFILVNLTEKKIKIFNKFYLIKFRKIYNRGYYIYSSQKLINKKCLK